MLSKTGINGTSGPGLPTAARSLLAAIVLLGGMVAAVPARTDVDVVPGVMVKGPDPGIDFAGIGGVAIEASSGEFAVAEGDRGRILFFGSDGWLLGRAVHTVTTPDGQAKPGIPSSIAYDRQGNLLVADRLAPYVDVLDYAGALVPRMPLPPPDDEFATGHGAVAVAVAPDGRILVGTMGDSAKIHMFSPDYDYLGSWGIGGNGPGQLNGITGIAATPDGHVVVACARTQLAIQIFDSDGTFTKGFGTHELGQGNVSLPGGVVVTFDGHIWVADEMRQVVQVFDADGGYLGLMGGAGIAAGEFQYPSALATDGTQRLVVAERLGSRVQVMRIR